MEAVISSENSCCFTGHRPQKLPPMNSPLRAKMTESLKDMIRKAYDEGFLCFYCGLCEGFDLLAAEVVLALQEQYPAVRLIGVLPYPTFGEEKSHAERSLQMEIREKCSDIVSVAEKYWRGCFQQRNQYMADRSSLVIAAYFGGSGGTWNTIQYARRKEKTIWNLCASISPKSLDISAPKPPAFLFPEWLAPAKTETEMPAEATAAAEASAEASTEATAKAETKPKSRTKAKKTAETSATAKSKAPKAKKGKKTSENAPAMNTAPDSPPVLPDTPSTLSDKGVNDCETANGTRND